MTRLAVVALLVVPVYGVGLKDAVIGSPHDLTASGTGTVKSSASNVCVFCHAPHNTIGNVTPLWNHTLSTQTYSTYSSSTYNSGTQTPAAGSSRLCLSCHDGTVAVGLTASNGSIGTTGGLSTGDVLGANLSTSHPISMVPVDDGSLATTLFASPPKTKDPSVQLVAGKIECTTCHDPHVANNDPATPMFLVRSNADGALCLACHDPSRGSSSLSGWTGGSHANATHTVPTSSASFGPYGSVGVDSCSNCHLAHNNTAAARSLRSPEETNCTPCHGGSNVSPSIPNIAGEYNKTYKHPTVSVGGVHDPTESIPVNNTRHAECADCHNSHAAYAQTGTALPPNTQAALAGVSGYDTSGVKKPASYEYQMCYKCHADSTNKPTASSYGRTAVRYPGGPMPSGYPIQPPRPADQYNLRLKFLSAIGHNVNGGSTVTTTNNSLRPYMLNVDGVTNNTSRPLTATTQLFCTDCHNNDQARSSNGTGPNGPHGSTYPHLLQFNLFQDGSGTMGTTGAAICGKCHNLTTVRNENPHGDHTGTGCTTCHDPHGVIGGTPGANRAMINFDTTIAAKATTYFGYFYNSSSVKGCYTNCHGESHNPHNY